MFRLIFCAALLAAFAANAQVLDEYRSRVPLPDNSQTKRDKAVRDALTDVLSRVSGQGPAAASRFAPILAHAETLVRSIGYETDDKNQPQLIAAFDPEAVDSELRQQGLPVHGILAGNAEDVTLSVSGIASTQDYARALAHLRAQPGVKNFQIIETRGDTLFATLRADGGAARLAGALSVGGVLKRDPAQPTVMAFVLKH